MCDTDNSIEVCSIKPINKDVVHKICSGQVVFSLAVAVKELLENSLDARATNIDIRLKNYGIDLIEVADNGTGVTEDNFAGLTLKYHTSKLSDYADLLGVSSFGFRGEALSSLCSLSDLTITTRHKDSEYATKIVYDHKGNITSTTPCSRQVGTTVSLTNLFCSLPVRQKEFHKNVKREFNKMTNLLYAYCLIASGVKITCSNQTNSNSKTIVVATQGSVSYKDNIACVFGLKQLYSLLDIKTEPVSNIKENIFRGLSGNVKESDESVNIEDVEIDLSEDSNDTPNSEVTRMEDHDNLSQKSQGYKNTPSPVEIIGCISSCAHGSGRSSTDRQFYYINSRPCEPNKIIKLVNETYKQYNPNQYPFVFLNINIERMSVDVNLTPDKRKVFLAREKGIIDVVKTSLTRLYESIPRTIKVEPIDNTNMKKQEISPELNQPRIFNSFIQQFSNKNKQSTVDNARQKTSNVDLKRKSTTLLDSFLVSKKCNNVNNTNNQEFDNSDDQEINNSDLELNTEKEVDEDKMVVLEQKELGTRVKQEITETINNAELMYLESTESVPDTQIRNVSDIVSETSLTIYCKNKNVQKTSKRPKVQTIMTDKADIGKYQRKTVNLKTSIDHVKSLLNIFNAKKIKSKPDRIKFKSAINPVFNKKCEEELSKEINKKSFTQMKVVGQFNLGFIIARLEDDLFIIDQHATDEIYNFETLQKTTELTSQKLVIPQQLELTGVNEQILMDNVDTFKKNGFTFEINENALPTRRVKLLTIPMSKNWIFGKDDIEELLFMLRENQYEHCRPSRVRAMFASRACRKSVMIGTALSKSDMEILVRHMAEIDKPWNCPHGRPTIRHLVNLAMVQTQD